MIIKTNLFIMNILKEQKNNLITKKKKQFMNN